MELKWKWNEWNWNEKEGDNEKWIIKKEWVTMRKKERECDWKGIWIEKWRKWMNG